MSRQYYQDSKFNAVLYGVQECPLGMSKSARFESDLTATVNVLSPLDSSIQPQPIKDCFRLGKFSSNAPRPRPILIKFVRKADVTTFFLNGKIYPTLNSFSHAIGFCFDQRSAALLSPRMRRSHRTTPL